MGFLEGFSTVYFTLFSPRNGLLTIREQVGTSGWVIVGFWSNQTLPKSPSIVFLLFSQNALRTYGKKIRLLKNPFAVNARDLKNDNFLLVSESLKINFLNLMFLWGILACLMEY